MFQTAANHLAFRIVNYCELQAPPCTYDNTSTRTSAHHYTYQFTSSHTITHQCIQVHILAQVCTHPHTSARISTHQPRSLHIRTHQYTSTHMCVRKRLALSKHFSCQLAVQIASVRISSTYRLAPAHIVPGHVSAHQFKTLHVSSHRFATSHFSKV